MKNHFKTKLISSFLLWIFIFEIFIQPIKVFADNYGVILTKYYNHAIPFVENELTDTDNDSQRAIVEEYAGEVVNHQKKELNKSVSSENASLRTFLPDISAGFIGLSEEVTHDDPSDNFFNFDIDSFNNKSDEVFYLEYDIKGIENIEGVNISINSSDAVGCDIIKKNNSWVKHRKFLDKSLLTVGNNHIMFSSPLSANSTYEIKNLTLKSVNTEMLETNFAKNRIFYTNSEGDFIISGIAPLKNGYLQIAGKQIVIKDYLIKNTIVTSHFEEIELLDDQHKSVARYKKSDFKFYSAERYIKTEKPYEKLSKVYNIDSLSFLNYKEVDVVIPKNSLNESTEITVQRLRPVDIPPLGSNIKNVTKYESAYRFFPDNTRFKNNIHLGIPYDEKLLPEGFNTSDIKTFYFDVVAKKWIPVKMDTIDTSEQKTVSITNHFTDYINGVIQTPESPEAESFTPTTLSGIQAANPTEGIIEIGAPQINNQGDANMNLPLVFPPGRNGLEPNLSISYNNNGGNGILGLGWNLNVPFIEVNTKWGVPNYSTSQETESYLLNGEEVMLYQNDSDDGHYLPHKKNLINRQSNSEFVPRVQGSFSKIQRLGSSPTNYTWVVTDNNGTKYYYGGEPNAILSTQEGNRAKWYLSSVSDRFGNLMTYEYDLVNHTVGQLAGGKEILLKGIEYGQHETEASNSHYIGFGYSPYINGNSSTPRTDVTFNNRQGVKEVQSRLLSTLYHYMNSAVNHRYENDITKEEAIRRGYEFTYKVGKFSKTLLDKVVNQERLTIVSRQGDTSQNFNETYSHTFEYYDDLGSGSLFDNPVSINGYNDVPTLFPTFQKVPTVIGGSIGNTLSLGGGISGGIVTLFFPTSYVPFSRNLTLGGTYNFSTTQNETHTMLTDIDGDGLPDKVFKKNNQLFFRSRNQNTFSSMAREIPGTRELTKSYTEAETKTGNLSLMFGSLSSSKLKSNTSLYKFVSDVNNDGILDIVDNRRVYFGAVNQSGGISYSQDSSNTPSLVLLGNAVDNAVLNELPPIEMANDMIDIVKMWRAPISGTVNISGSINKQHVNVNNGIYYAVERGNENMAGLTTNVLTPQILTTGTFATNINNLSVNAGDILYFRVGGANVLQHHAQVTWNPSVTYTHALQSANDMSLISSGYTDSFLLNGSGEVTLPQNGTYRLSWDSFNINNTGAVSEISDNVTISLLVYTRNLNTGVAENISGLTPVRFTKDVKINELTTLSAFSETYTVANDKPSYVQLIVHSSSQVDLRKIAAKFKPKLIYLTENKPMSIVPKYSNYSKQHTNYFYTSTNQNVTKSYTIKNKFQLAGCTATNCTDQIITLTIKNEKGKLLTLSNGRLAKIDYKLDQNGRVTGVRYLGSNNLPATYLPTSFVTSSTLNDQINVTIPFSTTSKIYFEYFTGSKVIANQLRNYQNSNNLYTSTTGEVPLSAYSNTGANIGLYKANVFSQEDLIGFGSMYRNWGQFGYKGSFHLPIKERINQSRINISTLLNDSPTGQSNESLFLDPNANPENLNLSFLDDFTNGSSSSPSGSLLQSFVLLNGNSIDNRWENHKKLYASTGSYSPYTRFDIAEGGGVPEEPSNAPDLYGAYGIIKKLRGEGEGKSAGLSLIAFGVSTNHTNANNYTLNEYQDLNGDGYPDIIGDQIQLTNNKGGLSQNLVYENVLNFSSNSTTGASAGGAPAIIMQRFSFSGGSNNNAMAIESHLAKGLANDFGSSGGTTTNSTVKRDLIDVNGDGLPDMVDETGQVRYNYGKNFSSQPEGNISFINHSTGSSFTQSSPNINLSNGDLALGFNIAMVRGKSKNDFIDLNGDGLPDKIQNNAVMFNAGTSFVSSGQAVESKTTTTISATIGGNATISIPIPIFFGTGPKLSFPLSASAGKEISQENVSYMDFNGDGFVDLLESDSNNELKVRYSRIKRTNMLKKVNRPLGSTITLDYDTKNPLSGDDNGSTFKMPFKKWALTKVTVNDGFSGDGEDNTSFVYEYENGFQDRRERKFLGFGKTRSHMLNSNGSINKTNVKEYLIDEITDEEAHGKGNSVHIRKYYFQKDLVKREYIIDAYNRKHFENTYSYRFFKAVNPVNNPSGYVIDSSTPNVFGENLCVLPLLYKTRSEIWNFDENNQNSNSSQTNSSVITKYSNYGQVREFRDEVDAVDVRITYHENTNVNKTVPKSHIVSGSGIYRRTETFLDAQENIVKIRKYKSTSNAADYADWDFTYNNMGNLVSRKFPKAKLSDPESMRYQLHYTYDQFYKKFVEKTQDNFGYTAITYYNYRGTPIRTVDANKQIIDYFYDGLNRLIKVKTPYNSWAIKNIYKPKYYGNAVSYALTLHNIADEVGGEQPKTLYTSVFTDGLGRVVQTKKQLSAAGICVGGSRYSISGKVFYDELGRITKDYLPEDYVNCSETIDTAMTYYQNLTLVDDKKTSYAYDAKDRPTSMFVHGLNALTKTEYGFEGSYFTQKSILPEGNQSMSFADSKGRVRISRQIGDESLDTRYSYNSLGELTDVKDAEDKNIRYTYDNFGQVTRVDHPDRGTILYKYDLAGRAVSFQNQNLINSGQYITYDYDTKFLNQINYPSHRVKYTYGASVTAPNSTNFAGRLQKVEDLSGTQEFKYGAFGEITAENRNVKDHDGTMHNYLFEYRYDSWGRTRSITYPDLEKVNYVYNDVGNLYSIKNTQNFNYLKSAEYKHFDQPTKLVYGNNIVTTNEYDIFSRARALQLQRHNQSIFFRGVYSYDKNQNITQIENNYTQHNDLFLGGKFVKNYSYDEFNRLSKAHTKWSGYEEEHEVALSMKYNKTHGIVGKDQRHQAKYGSNGWEHTQNSYRANYSYYDQSHAPKSIEYGMYSGAGGHTELDYDPNGNMVRMNNNLNGLPQTRRMEWDEQNRLLTVGDDGMLVSNYLYDHSGNRTIKRVGSVSNVYQNGELVNSIGNFDDYIIYPNGYMVDDLLRNKYTKHYYANNKKIATRLVSNNPEDTANDFSAETSEREIQKQLSVQTSAFTYTPFNVSTVCQTQLQQLLNMYNPNNGNPQFGQLSECYDQIVAIYTSGTMTACQMLENILQLSCVQLDGSGNYIIIDPETGYPPGEGIGEGNEDTDEYSCYTDLVDYFTYLEYTYNLTFPTDYTGDSTDNDWGNFNVLPAELQGCIMLPYRFFFDKILYAPGVPECNTFCCILEMLKNTNCYIQPPVVTEPEPEPYNPGETPVDTTPGDDQWQDPEPNPGTTPPDNPDTPDPIWWYHTDHLGSSTYLTDNFGKPTHYYDNLPFGETMVQHNQSNSTIGSYKNDYKFNGKELDDATGMYYYGARYYDPRISIFVSVDPLAEQTMTPYQYVNNNPVNMIDPTGMAPSPWRIFSDLFRDFKSMGVRNFHATAQKNGLNKSNTNYYTRMGRIFEDAVIRSLGETKNTTKFRPSKTSTTTVIPDLVGSGSKHYFSNDGNAKNDHRVSFPNASFTDAKFTNNVQFEPSQNPGQIRGFIDALSNMRGGYIDGKYDPKARASDYGAASLIFITPAGASIDRDILDYAATKNVNVYQRTMDFDEDNYSNIRVSPNIIPLHISGDKRTGEENIPPLLKGPGQSVETNWNLK